MTEPSMAGLERRLAELAAATPTLLLDLDAVDRAYRALAGGLPGVRLHYAVKCNPDLEVLGTLHRDGCAFEVASWPELALLLDLGVRGRDVLFSNPVKPVEHIRR